MTSTGGPNDGAEHDRQLPTLHPVRDGQPVAPAYRCSVCLVDAEDHRFAACRGGHWAEVRPDGSRIPRNPGDRHDAMERHPWWPLLELLTFHPELPVPQHFDLVLRGPDQHLAWLVGCTEIDLAHGNGRNPGPGYAWVTRQFGDTTVMAMFDTVYLGEWDYDRSVLLLGSVDQVRDRLRTAMAKTGEGS